jgi:hypothetical protein
VDYCVVVAAEDVDDTPLFVSSAAQRLRPPLPLLPLGGGLISGCLATKDSDWRSGCVSFTMALWGEYITCSSSAFATV